jgi:redox-sensitive bicupin YhaK (pirin superfamily)
VNLPAADKRMKPRYQDIAADRIPEASSVDGRVQVRVIAGACLGVEAVIDTRIPITYLDLRLERGGALTQPVDPTHTVAVYVYSGALSVDGRELVEGEVAILGAGDAVALSASGAGRALLLTGRPIGEPIAQYGPFVMNTEAEIHEAIADFRAGRFATIPATVG